MAELQTQTDAGEMTQIFVEFVMMQAQNAALFLGQVPNPRGGPTEVNLPLAKMFIDQLAVIRAKTQGNLNGDEQRVIDSALDQLEAAFEELIDTVGHDPSGIAAGTALSTTAPGPAPSPAAPAAQPAAQSPPAPPPESAQAAPPVEESRKRFTKSYGG